MGIEIYYRNKNIEKQFSSKYRGTWRYPSQVERKLLALENFLQSSTSLQDVVNYPPFHFHQLKRDRKGEWSIYLGNTGYRVTIVPCDENGVEIIEGDIIARCKTIKIVKITEVSNHYE